MNGSGSLGVGGPYKGLVPYTEEDAPFFFGREADRDIILANLLGSRLTLLYGASGVGKSSVLQAGVAHQLRARARASLQALGSPEVVLVSFSSWRDDPARGLLRAVEVAVSETFAGRAPEDGPRSLGLATALRAWSEATGCDLLLILDQFEDYFFYHPGEEGEGTFAADLARTVNEPDLRINVLISIREDALARLDWFKGRIPALFDNYLRLQHLDRRAGGDAIREPVKEYGRRHGQGSIFRVEPELVEEVLAQVAVGRVTAEEAGKGLVPLAAGSEKDRIETPYLQLVMTRLWNEEMAQGSTTLRLDTLLHLGGAEKIVQAHLVETMKALAPAEQEIAARVFRYLVTARGAKIALAAADLAGFSDLGAAEIAPVLDKLAERDVRILRPVADLSGTLRYEIFHDVLGPAILDWRRRRLREEEQAKAEARFRRERRRTLLLQSLGAVILLMVLASFLNDRAAAAREATARRLAVLAMDPPNRPLDQALLLSVEANERSDLLPETRKALIAALRRMPRLMSVLRGHTDNVTSVAFSPDGRTLASGSADGSVRFWSLANRQLVGTPLTSGSEVLGLFFSPEDGSWIAAGADGTVRLASPGSPPLVIAHEGSILEMSFSPDGAVLAAGTANGTILLWSLLSHQPLGRLSGHQGGVWSVAFSPDGGTLASGSADEAVSLWSVESRQLLVSFLPSGGSVLAVAFSPDGEILASGSTNGTVSLWPVESREILPSFFASGGSVLAVAFSPDGKMLACGHDNGKIRLWSVDHHDLLDEWQGHEGEVRNVSFSPDGEVLASGGADKAVRLWSLEGRQDSLVAEPSPELRARACRIANRNLSPEEWRQFMGPDAEYRRTCPELPSGATATVTR